MTDHADVETQDGDPEPGDEDRTYTMSVNLAVLDSLGINLYSNAAAVLSELVANAYDADAYLVKINWKKDESAGGKPRVVVIDDGVGMTVEELNKRFLQVGYQKRDEEGSTSGVHGRQYMGRKGIGKLSVFSIANTVSVYSTKDGQSHGLRIVVSDLKLAIKKRRDYHPEPIPVPDEYRLQGTTIVLDDLKGKRGDLTAAALRKRLARRFDVLSQKKREEGGFYIEINDTRLTYADRQELKNLQFIWELGDEDDRLPDHTLPLGIVKHTIPDNLVKAGTDWRVRGWFGTVKKPDQLVEDTEAGPLRNVIVLARKRPIQEGIIEKLNFSRIFANYVTGQIEADFLDLDEYEDIATSDRQRLMEDDDRVVALQLFLRKCVVKAAETWSEERPKRAGRDYLAGNPSLREWVDSRPEPQRGPAEKLVGTIVSLPYDEETEAVDKATLLRAGILAFERVGLRDTAAEIESLSSLSATDLLRLLGAQDAYESALWVDILRSRVEAISGFQSLTGANAKERVLQDHMFKNLWLLDPSWERATVGEEMEQDLRRVHPGLFARDADGVEIKGRFDIHYVTNGGRHVIVELKRYDRAMDIDVLVEQGEKYYRALKDLLIQKEDPRPDDIEIVFVVGAPPTAKNAAAKPVDAYIEDALANCKGRVRLYDGIIDSANKQYAAYLEASKTSSRIDDLLASLAVVDDDDAETATDDEGE